jgi:hypothetical protein
MPSGCGCAAGGCTAGVGVVVVGVLGVHCV